ncbi:MAG: type 4a pilus biogenesis protein PilO [Myxococcota bacterium]|nr:type 4a pilus biogenesis protein PilO [Myxococcota bacterium]
MNATDLLDKLAATPRSQRLALYALLIIGILAGYWFLLYSPKRDDIAQLQDRQVQLEDEKAKVKARAENRDAFEAELLELNNELSQALRQLPDQKEIPELVRRISNEGRRSGLEIRKFKTMAEVPRQYYAEVPVELEVYGSFHEVAMFFDRLAKLDRIVYVQNVELADPDERGGKVYVKVTGTAVTFRFLSDDEIARQSGQKGKGGKEGSG